MERKIGEIFEYNCEWYQVIECSRDNYPCIGCCGCKGVGGARINGGECNGNARKDGVFIIFKKLEKVGESYSDYCPTGRIIYFQRYRCYQKPIIEGDIIWHCVDDTLIDLEIKQNKEGMEEKHSNLEITGKNLKPFDLQAAKAGKPVCTRDGRKARIVCFDRKFLYEGQDYCIVALINEGCYNETVYSYTNDGLYTPGKINNNDLMMLPEKKEGWVNVYRDCDGANITKDDNIYSSKEKNKKIIKKGSISKNDASSN